MQTVEIRALMNNIAPVLKDFVSQSLSPVLSRIDEIDKRLSELPAPRDGKDADPDTTANVVFLRIQPEIEELRKTLLETIPEQINEVVSSLPVPKDGEPGKSVTIDELSPIIAEEVSKAVAKVPVPKDGEPGKSVTVDEIKPVLAEEVSKAVAALPLPKDAPPVAPEAIDVAVAAFLKANPPPAGKDGIALADVLIDREGHLNAILSNGQTKSLGPVVGKDGIDGTPGKDGKDAEPVTEIELDEEVSKSVASALKLLSERPDMTTMMMKEAPAASIQPPVNIHLPPVIMPEINFPAPVVNVAPAVNNIPAPVVNVGDRVGKKTRNVVKKHFKDGRIQEFEQEVIG